MNQASYTAAAQSIPSKLIYSLSKSPVVLPTHVQISLTNECDQQCPWCSCNDRDKNLVMPLEYVNKVSRILLTLGTRAITLSGGGEPMMHPLFWLCVKVLKDAGFKLGLTTNGNHFKHEHDFSCFDWVRVSLSSYRPLDKELRAIILDHPQTDWSFSFIASKDNTGLDEALDFAESCDLISHVRVTTDIFDPSIEMPVRARYSKAIWQKRQNHCMGAKDCWVSLLRPVINPDGSIAPCCGSQYMGAMKSEGKWLSTIEEYAERVHSAKPFNGSGCTVCYYDSYNQVLSANKNEPKHRLFV